MFNDREAGPELIQDIEQGRIFGASDEAGVERDEQGNLELDLVGIDTVEDAVELSIVQSSIKIIGESGFGFGNFGAWDERIFAGAIKSDVVR